MIRMRRWAVTAGAGRGAGGLRRRRRCRHSRQWQPRGRATTKGSFTAVVSFGDSLSDVGAYAPATYVTGTNPPLFFGGKFTTNGTGTIWVENVAAALGLAITPAQVGFTPPAPLPQATPVDCPAQNGTCTGYGQGGSRVTDPAGIGRDSGALTVPVKAQIEKHLARFGSFKDSDLILVFAGNNDVFVQAGTLSAKAAAILADTTLTPDQANAKLFQAQSEAQAAMKAAALELAGYVKDRILANGGRYVGVWNLPDSALTPAGQAQAAESRQVLTDLVDVFNLWLREGLTDASRCRLVDANAAVQATSYNNPSKYGIVNNTDAGL